MCTRMYVLLLTDKNTIYCYCRYIGMRSYLREWLFHYTRRYCIYGFTNNKNNWSTHAHTINYRYTILMKTTV